MLSLEECEPNRPPRSQNEPLASGTVKLEIIIGRFSTVTSANQTICRGSLHSFRIDSSTIITMSRVLPSLSFANSAIGICFMGNVVWAPLKADIARRETSGNRTFTALRSVNELCTIADLQEAALVGAVSEIDAVALRAGRDRPVHLGRHRAG